jgi:hypothetical protein
MNDNDTPCVRCGQLISPETTHCPLCRADQAAPLVPYAATTSTWSLLDTWRIGWGIWLNFMILMAGSVLASYTVAAIAILAQPAGGSSPLSGGSNLSGFGGTSQSSPFLLDPSQPFTALIVWTAVAAPFFAWFAGNTVRLVGDGINRGKGTHTGLI